MIITSGVICSFSTGFTSVHGEAPSAEYAKMRKESLESEFGQVLGTYGSKTVSIYYHFGPFLALYRAAIISFHVLKLSIWQLFVHDMKKRSIKFCETLIHLGPFYVKLGQALSTRPDILPTIYCQELAKLQDQIPPFPTHVAIKSIESQLGKPISEIFADISPEPIAAASLGQVYKAHLHTGELVAVKVQRPGMSLLLTLDALLFNMIGGQLKRFAKARKDLIVAVNEMVRHMFEEIDYILEGQNAERFASLYASKAGKSETKINLLDLHKIEKFRNLILSFSHLHNAMQSKMSSEKHWCTIAALVEELCYGLFELVSHCNNHEIPKGTVEHKKENCIKVPKIYWTFTRKAVLTMEWIDGIKLTDEVRLLKASLNRKELIDQGLYCSLRQLLEVGFFHADPHPGNLVATSDGSLAYFDFGMMGDIPHHYRIGLIQMLVHYVNRDSLGLANDFLSLGFVPEGVDIQSVSDALQASFECIVSYDGIMTHLYDIMYEFNFSLPPDYALVIRALGSLEGTAKALDPGFQVIESAYPFVIGRLLQDPNPDMRKILRELLIRNNGSIRWNRLERLVAAISEQASETSDGLPNVQQSSSDTMEWKSFDMQAVVAATEDLLKFIMSEKGLRVRIFLVRDIIEVADVFLHDEVLSCCFVEIPGAGKRSEPQGQAMARILKGLQYFQQAVKLAPEAWTAMLIRMALKPEVHKFILDIFSALVMHSSCKIPEVFWLCLSRLLNRLQHS
ncbi:ABC1 atypical kinase-like domain [Dillenia turbinata]|uniref:ABC1 atypical kinase-like domain n=1 Tax=Dillenia turbinata TaxID=194707 RepID=A0AAN8V544_9MAGN